MAPSSLIRMLIKYLTLKILLMTFL